MQLPFFTIGHSTRPIEAFADLLGCGDVGIVIDVRTIPRSRHNPQYNGDTLGEALAGYGIGYARIAELGGRRGRVPGVSPDVNGAWQHPAFHNYADYALTSDDFRHGLGELIAFGRERPIAIMCAEAVWWRCHRRIIADYLLARGEQVFHLMDTHRVEPAAMTDTARPKGDAVVYPTDSPQLPFAR